MKIAHLRTVVVLLATTFLAIALLEAVNPNEQISSGIATERVREVGLFASHQATKPAASPSSASAPAAAQDFFQNLENPLTEADLSRVDALTGSISASEWLGPLAPIAISPFFGVTILAGLAQFGPEWVPGNEFISNNAVLKNPAVFWVFLGLTLITSLPRFTKVSKPAAQAIDQLEAYAGIVTIILLRVLMTSAGDSITPEATEAIGGPVVLQAGIFSFTADTLMCIAAAINILVINTVKFFFEVSVWLIPFPFVDAMLEIANKSLCAALMAVYVWDPRVATAINLVIFAACLIAFRWIHRRTVYLRSMLFDPVWTLVSPGYGIPARDHLTVFNKSGMGPFAAKSRLRLTVEEDGWSLREQRLLFPGRTMKVPGEANEATIEKGLIGNQITFDQAEGKLIFSRRYSANLPTLARRLKMNLDEQGRAVDAVDLADVQPV